MLTDIYGVGVSLAADLARRIGMPKSEADLRARLKDPAIFGTLPDITQADLIYRPTRHIPRALIRSMCESLRAALGSAVRWDIGGSYSRGKPFSSDIDLVTTADFQKFADLINHKASGIEMILPPFSQGPDKVGVMMMLDLDLLGSAMDPADRARWLHKVCIKADIFLTNDDEYAFAMLFAIGSGKFNIHMRAVAKRLGFLLNHRGLFRRSDGKKENITTEKQIFEKLGMHYRLPSERIS